MLAIEPEKPVVVEKNTEKKTNKMSRLSNYVNES
jgi:hypothetical protein